MLLVLRLRAALLRGDTIAVSDHVAAELAACLCPQQSHLQLQLACSGGKRQLCLQALIDGQVLCVHGGLSPYIRTLDQIRTIKRVAEVPHEGAFCDLMWSDPEDIQGFAISPRGAGWLFGSSVVNEFNKINGALRPGLAAVCRVHRTVPSVLQSRVASKKGLRSVHTSSYHEDCAPGSPRVCCHALWPEPHPHFMFMFGNAVWGLAHTLLWRMQACS